MKFNNIDYGLYLVTNRDTLKGRDLIKSIEKSILGGVTIIQLREKNISSLDFYNIATKVKSLTDFHNIPLIINDRVDIALAINAAGVHIGQSDLPANVVRQIIGEDKILGVSAANLEEARLAVSHGANYLGIGAIFPTVTKQDARKVSISELKNIRDNISIPIVGIGGINKDNLESVMKTGVDGVALISAILAQDHIQDASKKLRKIIDKFV